MRGTTRGRRRSEAFVATLILVSVALGALPGGSVAAVPGGSAAAVSAGVRSEDARVTAAPAADAASARKDTDGDGLRDGFERAAGLDPRDRDSDHDGLRDPAEDLDGDALGNLGEQRWGTDPLTADTDEDGTPDGAEDADGDRISNAREQDLRPVPRSLRPGLAAAYADQPPSYRDGCHLALGSPLFRACTYGDRRASRTIALFGDSHAAQWLPALIALGSRAGWRIVSFTRSGCPFAVVKVHRSGASDVPCQRWRLQVLRWLSVHRPEVVLMTSLAGYWLVKSSSSWWAGLRQAVGSLAATTTPIVLADTPNLKVDVPRCLAANRRAVSRCGRARSLATHATWRAREAAVAVAAGAVYGDLTGQVCPYDPCPAVVDDLLPWRDQGHLTGTYSRQLAPSVGALIRGAIEPPSRFDGALPSRRRG